MEESCSSIGKKKYQEELEEENEDESVANKRLKMEENLLKTKVYSCPLCKYHCADNKLMSQHITRNHNNPTLPDSTKKLTPKHCIVTDPVQLAVLQETTTVVFPFTCPISFCDKGYYHQKQLNVHLKAKHTKKFNYCCTICGRLEYGGGYMLMHYSRNHPNDEYNLEKCEKLMAEVYKKAESTGESVQQVSYPCNVEGCEKVCEFPHELAMHLKSHDASARTCTYCFKIFLTNRSCEEHISRHHNSDLKTFKCDLGAGCQQSFFDEESLLRHKEYSKMQNPPKFSCDTCHRRFYWPMTFATHQSLESCEPRSEAKFNCSVCSKRYYRKVNLDKHEQRHKDGTLNLKIPGVRYKL